MRRRSFFTALISVFATIVGYRFWRGTTPALAQDKGMMSGGMMGDGSMGDGSMGEMMSPENMRGPMRTGMALFERHKLIHRTVTELPNGVHDVTTSTDPTTAALIQKHVVEMYERLDQNRPFPYPMSNSVPAMFANSTRYKRKFEMLPQGIAVTETSSDPQMVAVVRAHAQELNRFAEEGMPAMMRGMM